MTSTGITRIERYKTVDPPSVEVRFRISGDEIVVAIGRADEFDSAIMADLEDENAKPSDVAQALSHLLLLIERSRS